MLPTTRGLDIKPKPSLPRYLNATRTLQGTQLHPQTKLQGYLEPYKKIATLFTVCLKFPIGKHAWRNDRPSVDSITQPRANDLDPASPVRPSDGREVTARALRGDALRQQRRHPARRHQEDQVEETVVVLRAIAFVVFAVFRVVLVVGVIVVVEGGGWESARCDGCLECFGAHLPMGGWLLRDQAVFVVVGGELSVGVAAVGAHGEALGCGAGGRVGDREHGDNGAEDDGGSAGTAGADQGVAVFVVGFHGDGREGQVGAVDCYHCGLGEAGSRVRLLDGWLDGDDGYDDEEEKVECDG